MIYIEAIKLKNCQSWLDTTLQLSRGLNVFIADNNTGKSVLLKMLKITSSPSYYGRELREKLIRWGCEYAEVTYMFSDFSCGVVRVFRNKVLYYYTEDYRTIPFHCNTDVPIERLNEKLSLIMDYDTNFVANILDLDQSLFLVNSNSKSNDNLVKLLTEDERLKRVIPLFKEKVKVYENKLDTLSITQNRLQYKVDNLKYIDTDAMSASINDTEVYMKVIRDLIRGYEYLDSLESLTADTKNYDELLKLAEVAIDLESIDNIEIATDIDYNIDDEILDIMDLCIYLEDIHTKIEVILTNHIDEDYIESMLVCTSMFDTLNDLNNRVISLMKVISSCEDLEEELKSLEEAMNIEGRIYDCPIYGRVKHVDEKCIPIID